MIYIARFALLVHTVLYHASTESILGTSVPTTKFQYAKQICTDPVPSNSISTKMGNVNLDIWYAHVMYIHMYMHIILFLHL